MSQSKASTNYFDFAMSNSTNMVEIDGKDGNLYLHLQAKVVHNLCCSIFHSAKFEQTIIHQHVPLQRRSLIDGTAVTIILCLHV